MEWQFLESHSEINEKYTFNVDSLFDGEESLSYLASDINQPVLSCLTNDTFLSSHYFTDKHKSESDQVMNGKQDLDLHSAVSPSHESDSGVSEIMSFVGSPADQSEYGNQDADLYTISDGVDLDLTDFDFGSHENTDDFVSSFLNEMNSKPPSPAQQLSASGRPQRKCVINKRIEEPEHVDVNVDELSDDDTLNKTKAKVSDKKSLSYFSNAATFNPRKDIHILKVVKSPPVCSDDPTADDIMKALDEKSKKNAQQAKLNREKKKAYIKSLEDDVEKLKGENSNLSKENVKMKKEMTSLQGEVDYLKSVLVNASALSGLLKNISNVKEVKLSATVLGRRKHDSDDDHTYNMVEGVKAKRARFVNENLKKAGVCLHVNDGEACLEFCAQCSKLAEKSHGR